MATTVVFGATGNVGSQVVRELAVRGIAARAFVRDRPRAAAILPARTELVVGDLADRMSVESALDGAERVFLTTSNQPGQVEHETAVIDAAAAAGVRRLVKLTTIGARVGSELDFWDWHGRIERRLAESGIPAVLLRASFFMTNLLAAAEAVCGTGMLVAPAGDARISMIDPRDVAGVAAVALTEDGHEGRTHVVTGPEAVSYRDVAARLSAVLERPVKFVHVEDEAARAAMLSDGAPSWFADNLVVLFRLLRGGAAEEVTDTVRRLTGCRPRDFAEFARAHLDAFTDSAQPTEPAGVDGPHR